MAAGSLRKRRTVAGAAVVRRTPLEAVVHALGWVVLVVALVLVLAPLVFMFIASFMPSREIMRMPFSWWPSSFFLDNFWQAIKGNDGKFIFPRAILNSVVVSSCVALTTVLFSALAGYGLTKLKFRGSNIVFVLILSTLMVPFETVMIPLYVVVTGMGLQNTYAGLIVPFLLSAFGVFLMRQSLLTFPDELLDASRIDGASELGIFFRIVLPNMLPVMAVLGVLTFEQQWGNLIWPLLVVQAPELRTMPLYVVTFMEEKSTNEGAMVAVAALSSLPMLVIFFSLSRFFLKGANVFSAGKE
ncbi:MAG: carbohydrate ABC transporter permease [Trueperaceae bacterium]|nr:carbohydrate ABC transporter permease [Trueperaceae bacterium]MCO5173606.1 carbohydrate ABC transporter permease [Trueperaceae bacterium]MCW5820305.1 carbohydrate ABC transporter permease [Trueperaceae bacterium]